MGMLSSIMTLGNFLRDAAQFNLCYCLDVKEQIFQHFTLGSYIVNTTDKRSNEMMRIRVAKENWIVHKIWGNWNQDGNMLSNPICCIGVFEAFFLHANWFEVQYS